MPGVFPGGEGGRCVGLTTLPPSCAVVTKSGNLNFLETSGPLQACNGTALPLCIYIYMYIYLCVCVCVCVCACVIKYSQIYFAIKLDMFRTVPLSIIRSFTLYTQQWYMSYRFCCVYSVKLLMTDRGTVRNM